MKTTRGMRAPALLLALVGASVCRGPRAASDLYFGQMPPGDTPMVFAPGIVSLDDRFEQFLLYAGNDLFFGVTNADWSAFTLHTMTLDDTGWTAAHPAPFVGAEATALTAALSPDGNRAFFTAPRPSYPPSDAWMSERRDDGWTDPVKLGPPISSDGDEWEVSLARNGALYFSSSRAGGLGNLDIYRAPLVEGAYPTAENLGPPINTSAGDDLPYVAPDESYLIFASDRPGGLGHRDLYISFRVDGAWTDARNLGAPINSAAWDIYPSVSPDGRYLFFTRRDAWEATEDSDIWWVSTAFIDRWRAALVPESR